ncbi:MAG: extracellular solute-binding protein [Chloroflexi bacterium]|jgi:arabinogalactan oligomer/maltooligosaccharide transport system substrate-binding protein|nr:extracellular solute-binding protein [Chloroflexota bacterium]
MQRTTKLVTALGALAIVVGACGGGATATPAASAPASEAPSTAPSEAPSQAPALAGDLTVWNAYGSGGTAEGKAFEQILAEAKKVYPDVNVTVLDVPFDQLYTKFETAAASGGGPDMYIAPNDNLGNEVRAELLVDVTTAFAASENFTNTVEVAAGGSQVDGKWYMVPESLKAVAMFYRPSKVATPPATTDQLLEAVKGGVQFGINQSAYHNWGFWYAFGGQIMDDTGKCVADQGGVAEAMQYLADLKAAGAKFYTDGAKFQDDFKTGKLDAIIEGPWFTGDAKAAAPDDLAVAAIPQGPEGPAEPMTGVDGWYINAASANVELATAFAIYLTNAANQQIYVDVAGHVPTDKSIDIADPIVKGFAEAVLTGFPRPQIPELNNYWGNFGNALNEVLDKGTDPTAAVATACAEMNKANNK